MSNLFKKVTSAVAGLAIVFSIVSPIAGVSAAFTSLEAANKLATLGVIVDQSSNPADYRLGDTLTRREHVKVAMNLASCQAVSVPDTCNGSFSDMDSSDWGCKYAETALANGFIAANATFGPGRDVSKAEALKMIMNATNVAQSDNSVWQASYVEGAITAGVLSESFTDYDAAASRGWIFQVAAEAVDLCNGEDSSEEEDDLLGSLLDGLGGDDDDEDTDGGSDDSSDDTPVVSGSNNLVVSLSPSTPDGSTVPGGANGVPVAAFDVTAGDSDVIVDGFILKRKGLSDEDTLTALAVFGENGRVSKSRDDSQENDDQANLNFNEEEVVLAGETRTFIVVADVQLNGNTAEVTNDEFSIELLDIETNANVSFEGKLIGETFRIAGVDAPVIVFQDDGTVTNPTLGDTDAEIFKFEIEGADDEDVIVKSMTFRSSETDVEDNLRNFKLTQNGDVLAETEFTTEEYLTFNLGEGFVVEEDTDLSFVVTADVVEGATDTFAFFIDRNLDITAISTKFDTVASVNIEDVDEEGELGGTLEIEAGELILTRINPEVDEIKEDKDDVILGEFTVENQSGGDLDLEELGVVVELTGTAFFDNGAGGGTANNGTQDGSEPSVTAENVFDDFELLNKNTGRTDTLEFNTRAGNTLYEDDSLGIQIPEGITSFVIRADTADEITNFDTIDINLSFNTFDNSSGTINRDNGFFIVEEQDDDEEVEDISPSFISFDNVEGIESTAELSINPLATTTAVRGGEGVAVLEFEVEADEASTLEIDEIRISGEFVDLGAGATIGDILTTGTGAEPISNDEISNISIYLDSVSPSNLLESEGGNDIENNGELTFNDFDNIFIQPNETQTFVLTIDIIDGDTVENIGFRNFRVVDIDIDDEDNDDVEATAGGAVVSATNPNAVSGNRILVTPAGLLTASFDDSNEANEDPKTLLAGSDDQVVFSLDVQSTNEPTDVEDVTFTLSGADLSDIRNTIANASLYLDGVFIDQNTNSDITVTSTGSATILFDDLDDLIIPEQTAELELRLNSESIGFQRVGSALNGVTVVQVDFAEIEGDESDEDVTDVTATGSSQAFSFARGVLVPRVSGNANTSNPTIGVDADLGDNRADNDNTIPNITLNSLAFDVSGTSDNVDITLSNTDGSTSITLDSTTDAVGNILTFDLSTFTADERIISSGNEEFFELQITPPAAAENVTVSIELLRDGLNYTVEGDTFTTNASDDLEVTTYTE